MDEHTFLKNVEKWSLTNPKKALMLPYHNAGKKSSRGTAEEAKKWFAGLDLKKVQVLFVYGVGDGHYYEAAKKWLRKGKDRALIFLEDDLCAIYRLFHTEVGTEILNDPQTRLHYFSDIEECKGVLQMLHWEFLWKKIEVSALRHYVKTKGERYTQLRHRILHDASLRNSLVDEYLKFGAGFFKNFYTNMLSLPGAYLGNSLFGKFKKVPAIICGAGPSLNKNIDLLKSLGDKAIIFAGGSALNALKNADITPHFGAALDPNNSEYDRLRAVETMNLPIFYRNRLLHSALEAVHGPRLYITGSGGYDVSEWFENNLKIEREPILDEGHNVLNFCLEIANALGCDPIIFVGIDLAYTGLKSYASGVVSDNKVKKKEILKANNFDEAALLKKDIYGKPIYTLWKWVAESEWIGEFAEKHSGVRLINATEGGLGFPGVENKTLKYVVKKYLTKQIHPKKKIALALKKCTMPQVTKKKVRKLVEEFKQSIEKSINCMQVLLEELETMQAKVKNMTHVEKNFNPITGRAALFEMDLSEEPGYKYVLEVFDEVFMRLVSHEIQRLRTGHFTEKQRHLKKMGLNAKRISFLKAVAEVNKELISMALEGRTFAGGEGRGSREDPKGEEDAGEDPKG